MIPTGSSTLQATLDGTPFDLYTYRPAGPCEGLLLIFHGTNRNADDYRDYARDVADRCGLIVIAPHFDAARFPNSSYHRGNIVDGSGNVRPRSQWTTRFVPLIAAWARQREGAALPYWLWGHSAGGQFLSRVAAFEQPAARRIVIANPSIHVLPLLGSHPNGERAPYGMGDAFPPDEELDKLRGYLELPVTLHLGGADNDPDDPLLASGAVAMRQGAHRLERGENTYALGESVARLRGFGFGWRKVIGPEIGHSARQMLRSRRIYAALGVFDLAPVYRVAAGSGEHALRIRMLGTDARPGEASAPKTGRAA